MNGCGGASDRDERSAACSHRWVKNRFVAHRVCEVCGVNQEKTTGRWVTTYDPADDPSPDVHDDPSWSAESAARFGL